MFDWFRHLCSHGQQSHLPTLFQYTFLKTDSNSIYFQHKKGAIAAYSLEVNTTLTNQQHWLIEVRISTIPGENLNLLRGTDLEISGETSMGLSPLSPSIPITLFGISSCREFLESAPLFIIFAGSEAEEAELDGSSSAIWTGPGTATCSPTRHPKTGFCLSPWASRRAVDTVSPESDRGFWEAQRAFCWEWRTKKCWIPYLECCEVWFWWFDFLADEVEEELDLFRGGIASLAGSLVDNSRVSHLQLQWVRVAGQWRTLRRPAEIEDIEFFPPNSGRESAKEKNKSLFSCQCNN